MGRGNGLGSRWAPFMFLFWAPGRMDGPRRRGGPGPSYFFSGLLGRMDGPRSRDQATVLFSFWVLGSIRLPNLRLLPSLSSLLVSFSGSWVGWMIHGKEIGFSFDSLYICSLRDGWIGSGLLFNSLYFDGWAAAKELGLFHVSFFLGSWVGWEVVLISLHIAFLGSWVGWMGRGQEAGLPLGFLHVSFFLGPGSWVG